MSCLFNSLSYFLDEDTNTIRQTICDYLGSNKPIMDGIETKQILLLSDGDNYVNHMRRTSTWGGAIEIQAACNIWNMDINVINIRDNTIKKIIEFKPVCGESLKQITITWNGGHYEPVRQ